MSQPSVSRRLVAFGTFEADLGARELRKNGAKIRLQDQPFQVLALLLEKHGEVVTREELKQKLWSSDTFVDFDNGLNTAINKIREALGDSAENPRFVETLPRRGYRFIAPVNGVAASSESQGSIRAAPSPQQTISGAKPAWKHTRFRWAMIGTAATVAAGLAVGGWLLYSRKAHALTEKDTIVLADFTNTTGDPVFDGTLRQGLSVQLEQTPFLQLVSEEQIRQTLRMMKQPPEATLSPNIAREVCQRIGSTTLLESSIAQIGAQYLLTLEAVNCATGESLASTETQASDKSHVLDALGRASSDIRKKLGESLATVQKYDTPLVQATTPSLEALQAFNLGFTAIAARFDFVAAIPLLQRAVHLDPNFALAYTVLGGAQSAVFEPTLASQNARKAFELRAGLSAWEKFVIETGYYANATGDLEKAREVAEVRVETYPRDYDARNDLGYIYQSLGQNEKALPQFREGLRLYPQSGSLYTNLVLTYIALDRFEEARATADEMKAKNLDSLSPAFQYGLAFLENDAGGMEQQVAAAKGIPFLGDMLLGLKGATAGYYGRREEMLTFARQALALAERAKARERAAWGAGAVAAVEALYGNEAEARQWAASALRLSTGRDVQYAVALTLALTGDTVRAQALADDLGKRFPDDTFVQFNYLPTVHAQLALSRNDAPKAIEALQPAVPYEMCGTGPLNPAYFRGLAYLAEHRGSEAASEFQKILDHRGIVGNSISGALAHLQIGRAYAMQGDTAKARATYQHFLTLWKDADPNIPILKQAKAEYAKLQH